MNVIFTDKVASLIKWGCDVGADLGAEGGIGVAVERVMQSTVDMEHADGGNRYEAAGPGK